MTAEEVRQYVLSTYIHPARAAGKLTITVRSGDVHRALSLAGRYPMVCDALRTQTFLTENLLSLSEAGPKHGANVYFTFKL